MCQINAPIFLPIEDLGLKIMGGCLLPLQGLLQTPYGHSTELKGLEILKEMMENAKWREDQRTKNVKHFRKMDEEEEKKHIEGTHDPDFIRNQLVTAASSGTVEKRIQSNKHNIQRGVNDMDKNFARR